MKKLIFHLLSIITIVTNCNAQENEKQNINTLLNNWHSAAAEANYSNYFEAFTADAVFIGTDATENWNRQAFEAFSKPYFDKGKAWNFKPLERNIYISSDKKTAWFDELLDTQMKICRGSGVLVLQKGKWKIKHYVLSMTIPNDKTKEVVNIKESIEDSIINHFREKNKN